VLVNAKGHDLGLAIPFTGARYYMSDSVILEETTVRIPRMTLHDDKGNPLVLEGSVQHNGMFDNLTYHVNVHADKAIVLDLPETPNRLYSGRIFATGDVVIDGDRTGCEIDAVARTESGSSVAIMTKSASSVSSSDFVQFVDHTVPEEEAAQVPKVADIPFTLNLNLLIDATPDILARVVIDPRTGDQLRGRGEGNLRISYNTADGCTMFG
jgi:hypothetical protein